MHRADNIIPTRSATYIYVELTFTPIVVHKKTNIFFNALHMFAYHSALAVLPKWWTSFLHIRTLHKCVVSFNRLVFVYVCVCILVVLLIRTDCANGDFLLILLSSSVMWETASLCSGGWDCCEEPLICMYIYLFLYQCNNINMPPVRRVCVDESNHNTLITHDSRADTHI